LRHLNGVLNPFQIATVPYIKWLGISSEWEGYEIEVLEHGVVEIVEGLLPPTTAEIRTKISNLGKAETILAAAAAHHRFSGQMSSDYA
jgi:hypothetical protein